VSTVLERSPVKIYFIFLAILSCEGVIRGSSVQSLVRSLQAQKLHLLAPTPFGSVSGLSSPVYSTPSA
jgi:hypothetical protein